MFTGGTPTNSKFEGPELGAHPPPRTRPRATSSTRRDAPNRPPSPARSPAPLPAVHRGFSGDSPAFTGKRATRPPRAFYEAAPSLPSIPSPRDEKARRGAFSPLRGASSTPARPSTPRPPPSPRRHEPHGWAPLFHGRATNSGGPHTPCLSRRVAGKSAGEMLTFRSARSPPNCFTAGPGEFQGAAHSVPEPTIAGHSAGEMLTLGSARDAPRTARTPLIHGSFFRNSYAGPLTNCRGQSRFVHSQTTSFAALPQDRSGHGPLATPFDRVRSARGPRRSAPRRRGRRLCTGPRTAARRYGPAQHHASTLRPPSE